MLELYYRPFLRIVNTYADIARFVRMFCNVKRKDTKELIKDFKLKDRSIRRHAIEMLGIMGDEKAVDALTPVLKDRNRFV